MPSSVPFYSPDRAVRDSDRAFYSRPARLKRSDLDLSEFLNGISHFVHFSFLEGSGGSCCCWTGSFPRTNGAFNPGHTMKEPLTESQHLAAIEVLHHFRPRARPRFRPALLTDVALFHSRSCERCAKKVMEPRCLAQIHGRGLFGSAERRDDGKGVVLQGRLNAATGPPRLQWREEGTTFS
ncbi:hypothetical protein BV898_06762 [Hypsibius exemplaris]|uniref:Uncharacterized protein n=1 Tax=Hypsibius exemplaris TaxID=2072580 RepID=A0A1W0WVF4_HYPEX|nr:hypothetical protein BV898_06762 [Hypsibius exemplaris]